MPYLKVNDKNYYYAGNIDQKGMPVIFCHGSGGGHHHWLYQFKNLPHTINTFAVDLPGHGRSQGKPEDAVGSYRDWLQRFINVLGIGPFILAGHSLGGAIALAYALKYPDQLKGLILIGTGARLRVLPSFLEELNKGNTPKELINYVYTPDTPEDLVKRARREIEDTDPSVYLADFEACDKFDIIEHLHHINKPTLIICGSEDSLTPVKYSRFLKENLPQSKLEVIQGAGHMVMLEKPEAVNRAISRFIEEDLL